MFGIYHPFTFVDQKDKVDETSIYLTPSIDVIFSGATTAQLVNFDTGAVVSSGTAYTWSIDGNNFKSIRVKTSAIVAGQRYAFKVNTYFWSELIEYVDGSCLFSMRSKNSCANSYHDWESDSVNQELFLHKAALMTPDLPTETISIVTENGEKTISKRANLVEKLQYLGISGFNVFFKSLQVNDYVAINIGAGIRTLKNIDVGFSEQAQGRYGLFEVKFEYDDYKDTANSCCEVINIDDILNPENPDNSQAECIDFVAEIAESSGTLSATLTDAPTGTPTYKWYRNGVLISTGTTASVTTSGEYSVIVQVGVCRASAKWVKDNGCSDFQLSAIEKVGNTINATVSNIPDGETLSISIVLSGVEVATALPYEALATGTYWVTASAGECSKLKGIYVELQDEDCLFTAAIDKVGLTLEADTDAATPTYLWQIDRGGGAGKETIGAGASVGLVGPGIYFLTVTNGGCATPKEAYYFQEQTSSRPIDITIQQASGFEFVITRVNLLLIDPAMYAVFVDGILVNYTASTPTLASEFTIAADGKLTFSESHPLDFSEIVIIDI